MCECVILSIKEELMNLRSDGVGHGGVEGKEEKGRNDINAW